MSYVFETLFSPLDHLVDLVFGIMVYFFLLQAFPRKWRGFVCILVWVCFSVDGYSPANWMGVSCCTFSWHKVSILVSDFAEN